MFFTGVDCNDCHEIDLDGHVHDSFVCRERRLGMLKHSSVDCRRDHAAVPLTKISEEVL